MGGLNTLNKILQKQPNKKHPNSLASIEKLTIFHKHVFASRFNNINTAALLWLSYIFISDALFTSFDTAILKCYLECSEPSTIDWSFLRSIKILSSGTIVSYTNPRIVL